MTIQRRAARNYTLQLSDGSLYTLQRTYGGSRDQDLLMLVGHLRERTGVQVESRWIPWHAIVTISVDEE